MVRCLARVCALVLLAVLASGQVVEPPFANEPPEVIGRIAPLYPPSATPAAATKKRWSSDTASPTPPPPLTPAPSVEVPPGCTLNDTLLECDDTSSVFGVYSGNWTHCSVGCAPGAYNGTSSRSDTPTDYVQLNFKGARIRLFSTVGTTRGIMTYTIGGGGYVRSDIAISPICDSSAGTLPPGSSICTPAPSAVMCLCLTTHCHSRFNRCQAGT